MSTMINKVRAAIAGYRLYQDPNRLDDFLEMVNRLATEKDFARVVEAIVQTSPRVAQACVERRVMKVDPDELALCPAGSLGRAVSDHCTTNGIHPSTFPKRPTDTEAQFVLAHIENTHDVWHPVTGFAADPAGEIGLQAFYLAQFPNPIGLILLGIAPLHVASHDHLSYPRLLDEITRGWLLGRRASSLFGYAWDENWNRPLADVQRDLGIDIEGVQRAMEPGTSALAQRLPRGTAGMFA